MGRLWRWIDENALAILAGFLLVFIPLYPKWPLFDILYGYNVRVRLEDILVALVLLVLLVQLARRKIRFAINAVGIGLLAYLLIGFLSVISAVFLVQTVPFEYLHVAKTVLHWLRRAEYFSLFFLFFAAVRSPRLVKIYIGLFFAAFLGVIVYGYGQKYLYWPAFSTMNREFAKGWWLYLTEHARVLSTFGGHYDLAGYLVIALTLAWSFFFSLTKRWARIALGLLLAGGFWLLILTASRISFGAYILGLTVVIFLWMFKKGVGWAVSRWIVTVSLSLIIMLSFGDLSDRFLRLIRVYERVEGLRAVLLRPQVTPPAEQAVFLENNLAAVTSRSDVPPLPRGAAGEQPADVVGPEVPLLFPEKTASGATILVPRPRTYSRNALLFDLSVGIRLDATWPRAIAGLKNNFLLGSGYATLTKENKYQYTEGESTDNDYLRSLGETGLLGFAAFFGTVGLAGWLAFQALRGIRDEFLYALTSGFVGLTAGLLFNALLIDIFEASKVAYAFWGMAGLTMGTLFYHRQEIASARQPWRIGAALQSAGRKVGAFLRRDVFWLLPILLAAVVLRLYQFSAPVADWHSWRQADTAAVTRSFLRGHSIHWLYPVFDDLSSVASGRPNPKGYRMVEFPLYNAVSYGVKELMPEWTVEEAGRAVTIASSVAGIVFLFLLCRRFFSRRAAYFSALALALLPYSIYYGRVILPDPAMVALSLGAVWWAAVFAEKERRRYYLLSIIFAAAALLVKPFALFLLLPIGYIWLAGFGWDRKKLVLLVLFVFLAGWPLLLWRMWIGQFPEGIPASSWLLNGDGIRFKGAFWYWLFGERIGKLVLGYWGLVLAGVGLVGRREGKYRHFLLVYLLSSILYLLVFATGNVRHDYYQILIVPSLAMLVGLGLDFLFTENSITNNLITRCLALVCALFALGFSWYYVRDFYHINHPEIVAAGHRVRELTDWKALVVAPYDGDTAFLYQTDRRGWPLVEGAIEEMIDKGAQYYVSVRFDELTNKLVALAQAGRLVPDRRDSKRLYAYKLLDLTDKYVVIQLVPDDQLPKR